MKLDSESSIFEIYKYYGTLDEVYVLMRSLNNKTYKFWDKGKLMINKIITKRKLHNHKNPYLLEVNNNEYLKLEPIAYDLFELPPIDYPLQAEVLLKTIEKAENPELLRPNSIKVRLPLPFYGCERCYPKQLCKI